MELEVLKASKGLLNTDSRAQIVTALNSAVASLPIIPRSSAFDITIWRKNQSKNALDLRQISFLNSGLPLDRRFSPVLSPKDMVSNLETNEPLSLPRTLSDLNPAALTAVRVKNIVEPLIILSEVSQTSSSDLSPAFIERLSELSRALEFLQQSVVSE